MHSLSFQTEIGWFTIQEEDGALTAVLFSFQREDQAPTALLQEAKRQILEYLAGKRKTFDLPYRLQGTAFQKKVWTAMAEIPYGEIRSYSDLAAKIGSRAYRAVGQACSRVPLFLILPVHRVVSADHTLGGFGGYEEIKRLLLKLEKAPVIGLD